MKKLGTFLAGLKTAQLVDMYNLVAENGGRAIGVSPVKKFSDRVTAEKRLGALITGWAVTPDEPEGYENFFGEFALLTARAGIELPEPERKPEPEPTPERRAPGGEKTNGAKDSSPHLNLLCPVCKFYAKTTVAWLARGRLLCPISGHGALLTTEERRALRAKA